MFSHSVSHLLNAGARLNQQEPLRNGNIISLPGVGDLVVAGDLHNHHRNFERVQTVANLEKNPQRHVILQEIVHGGVLGADGGDHSLEMLLDAIAWADKFPGQVHFLLANHDLAQVQGQPVMKDGYDLTDRFTRYFKMRAGGDWAGAQAAFRNFFMTMPLGAVTFSGIMLTHSLPGPRDMPTFDPAILRRALTDADYARNGSVYQMIWGRGQTPEVLATLAKAWWSELFICGHQAQDTGFGTLAGKMLILDSSHNHGVYLKIDLARPYTLEDLTAAVKPLASVA
ncbi:MAG TPA: metallophosphoesterase [Phycisphaerae bacterium]|jgi:hypothetical protein|nr:metallophosphoesterase [Phycisphaerae bacterium]